MKLHAFEDRALPHLDAVYRLAMVLANDPHDASDLVHETYRQAMDVADHIGEEGGEFRLWLLKILRSVFSAHAGGTTRTPTSLFTCNSVRPVRAISKRYIARTACQFIGFSSQGSRKYPQANFVWSSHHGI